MSFYAYTCANALEDGELVDVSEIAREAGFRLHVTVTRAVWEKCVAWNHSDNKAQVNQDESGRLWDVIWMMRSAMNSFRDKSVMQSRLFVIPRDGKSRRPKLTTLKASIHWVMRVRR